MESERNEIVFVCTANTCRSPMAEALFRHAIEKKGDKLGSLKISSAGVSAFPGQPANENSIAALKKVGIDISAHQSQPITEELASSALAFVCMTDMHMAILAAHMEPPPENLFLMRQFMEDDGGEQIPDPFGQGFEQYEASRDSMVEAIPSLMQAIEKLLDE